MHKPPTHGEQYLLQFHRCVLFLTFTWLCDRTELDPYRRSPRLTGHPPTSSDREESDSRHTPHAPRSTRGPRETLGDLPRSPVSRDFVTRRRLKKLTREVGLPGCRFSRFRRCHVPEEGRRAKRPRRRVSVGTPTKGQVGRPREV